MREPEVILVDAGGREVGRMGKRAAHEGGGKLHRAFSVFLFDGEGRWLLQRRAEGKYHFPGLWSNACCSHPAPGEGVMAAAVRRVGEELGTRGVLREAFQFTYRARSEATGLTEYEYDHVLVGGYCGEVRPDPGEVSAIRLVGTEALRAELVGHPERFTPWFRLIFSRVAAVAGAWGREGLQGGGW